MFQFNAVNELKVFKQLYYIRTQNLEKFTLQQLHPSIVKQLSDVIGIGFSWPIDMDTIRDNISNEDFKIIMLTIFSYIILGFLCYKEGSTSNIYQFFSDFMDKLDFQPHNKDTNTELLQKTLFLLDGESILKMQNKNTVNDIDISKIPIYSYEQLIHMMKKLFNDHPFKDIVQDIYRDLDYINNNDISFFNMSTILSKYILIYGFIWMIMNNSLSINTFKRMYYLIKDDDGSIALWTRFYFLKKRYEILTTWNKYVKAYNTNYESINTIIMEYNNNPISKEILEQEIKPFIINIIALPEEFRQKAQITSCKIMYDNNGYAYITLPLLFTESFRADYIVHMLCNIIEEAFETNK